MSVPICKFFYDIRANSGKIITFRRIALFRGRVSRLPWT